MLAFVWAYKAGVYPDKTPPIKIKRHFKIVVNFCDVLSADIHKMSESRGEKWEKLSESRGEAKFGISISNTKLLSKLKTISSSVLKKIYAVCQTGDVYNLAASISSTGSFFSFH